MNLAILFFRLVRAMFSKKSQVPQWIVDLHALAMLDANEAGLKLWRMPLEQFRSTPPVKFFHPDEIPKWKRYIESGVWGESGPWKCIRGDGSIFYCTVRYQLIEHEGREVAFVFALRAGDSMHNVVEINHNRHQRRVDSDG